MSRWINLKFIKIVGRTLKKFAKFAKRGITNIQFDASRPIKEMSNEIANKIMIIHEKIY